MSKFLLSSIGVERERDRQSGRERERERERCCSPNNSNMNMCYQTGTFIKNPFYNWSTRVTLTCIKLSICETYVAHVQTQTEKELQIEKENIQYIRFSIGHTQYTCIH
jgi:hypothetical protein